MIVPSLCLVFAAGQAGAELARGLRAGESAAWVAAAPEFGRDDWNEWGAGRLYDAFSGALVAGATVETWTEDLQEPLGQPLLLGRARSAADGTVRYLRRQGGVAVEKVRVSAPGYCTTVLAENELNDENVSLFPALRPFRGRVLDLAGRPIPGAELRSKQSCAHAPPAVVAYTDAFGRFEVMDFPPEEDGPELLLSSPGFAARRWTGAGELRALCARDGGVDLYLPARREMEVRVLDEAGRPLQNRRIVNLAAEVYQTAWTDGQGRARFPSCYGSELGLFLYDALPEEHLASFYGPPGLAPELRRGAAGRAGECLLAIELAERDWDLPGRSKPGIQIFHEAGIAESGAGEHWLPPGKALVVAGSDFEGWREERREVVLADQPTILTFDLQPAPSIRVIPPASEVFVLHVQAGADSVSHEDPREWVFPVPAGQPITLLAECAAGELRRVELPPLAAAGEVEADLSSAEALLRPGLSWYEPAGRNAELRLSAVDRAGQALVFSTSSLEAGDDWLAAQDEEAAEHRHAVPAGLPLRVRLRAAGFVPKWVEVEPLQAGESREVRVALDRVCTLRIEGALSETLENLLPGPLQLLLLGEHGHALAVDLVLEEGETRMLFLAVR